MTEFGKHTTADEVLEGKDLTGLKVFVTGANSGLGKETARAMAAKGAHVIMAGRDPEKLDSAFTEITAMHPDASLETILVDLASLESVRACAKQANERFDRIDLLINNAAVMACPKAHTEDGFEMQFGTNHLGHFALTKGLMPLVRAGKETKGGGRIVNVASRGHFITDVDLADPHFENREYDPWQSYGQAKTANILFTVGLERRFGEEGIHALTLHPGGIQTNLSRHLSQEQEEDLLKNVTASDPDFEFKTEAQGAATQVWAATAEELEGVGGVYCDDCHVAEVDDRNPKGGVRSYALDPQTADKLWQLSEEMTGEVFAA
ncbi:MAG: SDR family NAD(P)-dependent oxidoreductase [Pseudomonadota bacterium]|nr:SDR family NAD(P)-dependent oxidoreductase [Pseudomonadota bacterium]